MCASIPKRGYVSVWLYNPSLVCVCVCVCGSVGDSRCGERLRLPQRSKKMAAPPIACEGGAAGDANLELSFKR